MEPNATKTTAAALKVAKETDNTTDATALKSPISTVVDLILYPIGYATDHSGHNASIMDKVNRRRGKKKL